MSKNTCSQIITNENSTTFDPPSLGECYYCDKKQKTLGKSGLWILHKNDIHWICNKCKIKHKIYSYPVACEWCKYDKVKWYQGHTYDCPRCKALDIKQL